MRPVEKKKPDEAIKCLTSLGETKTVVIQHEYDPYRDAVEPLSANIGLFCSYCEEPRAIGDKGKAGPGVPGTIFCLRAVSVIQAKGIQSAMRQTRIFLILTTLSWISYMMRQAE